MIQRNCYLWFNPDFDEASDDGEGVADDEQKIPAVDELQSVSPAHAAAERVFKILHVLLIQEKEDIARCYISPFIVSGLAIPCLFIRLRNWPFLWFFFFLNLSCQAIWWVHVDVSDKDLLCSARVWYTPCIICGVFFAIQAKQSYRTGKDIAPATAECEQTLLTQDRMQPNNTPRLCRLEAPRPRTPRTPRTPT